MIIPTAEPFFIPGGPIGVILIHGFTGTPKEMLWMGEYLADRGHTVIAPRLAGHATAIKDMNRIRWWDWLYSVEDSYHQLNRITKKIVVAGLSMGGILSLLFSSKHNIDGVIAMSTPYDLPPDPRMKLIPFIWPVIPVFPKGEPDWQDPQLQEDHIDYPYYPTRAIIELKKLVIEMQQVLPRLTLPALLMHSIKDRDVPYENVARIFKNLGSQEKEIYTVENSGHVIVRDVEKEKVFEAAAKFILKIGGETV